MMTTTNHEPPFTDRRALHAPQTVACTGRLPLAAFMNAQPAFPPGDFGWVGCLDATELVPLGQQIWHDDIALPAVGLREKLGLWGWRMVKK